MLQVKNWKGDLIFDAFEESFFNIIIFFFAEIKV